MRLWWNQSLASCGWWLVGDPSVRPFVRPYVHTYVKRVSASLYLRSSSIVIETATRRSATALLSESARRENFGAENWTSDRACRQTNSVVWPSVSWTIFEELVNRRILFLTSTAGEICSKSSGKMSTIFRICRIYIYGDKYTKIQIIWLRRNVSSAVLRRGSPRKSILCELCVRSEFSQVRKTHVSRYDFIAIELVQDFKEKSLENSAGNGGTAGGILWCDFTREFNSSVICVRVSRYTRSAKLISNDELILRWNKLNTGFEFLISIVKNKTFPGDQCSPLSFAMWFLTRCGYELD